MKSSLIRFAWLGPFVVLVLAVASAGAADDASRLDELRRAGAVGERYDGTAVVRATGADAAVKSFVDQLNAKRRAIYDAQAKTRGAPPAEVGKIYSREIADQAPKGTWLLGEDGKWTQKE
jgi:uncharacterized protein YdbL (DUF1318 family)